jgi:hypothetical protein
MHSAARREEDADAPGHEKSRAFRHGRDRFEVFVGAAVLANNLLVIAAHLERRKARRRPCCAVLGATERARALPPLRCSLPTPQHVV